jgi:hypothetical protein
MTPPLKQLIPDKLPDNSEEIINWFVNCLEEARNFGSQLFNWDLNENNHKDDTLPILMLLRHQIDILDSLSILAKCGSGDTAKILGRALLENVLYMEYLLEKDHSIRAYAFLTEDTLTQIHLAKRSDYDSSQGKEMSALFKKELGSEISDTVDKETIWNFINSKIELLESETFKLCYEESQNLRKKTNKPNWFSYFSGPKNIAELAKHLGKKLFYEIMYRKWSRSVHGTDVYIGKVRESENEGGVHIVQIRFIDDLQEVVTNCLLLTCSVYKRYTAQRLEVKNGDYGIWYLQFKDNLEKLVSKKYLIVN